MRIVLLSGGSGKRLWPLSNEIRSKVFLKLLPTENGGKESMIQRVCRQLDEVGLLQSTVIVTHKSQLEITRNHVGDTIPIICENYKRGTFTAVALAASYYHSKKNVDPNETICVLPVDLFVETSFFELLCRFPDVLYRSQANLALLGTAPTYPSNQFGYIVPNLKDAADYFSVAHFVEKPDELLAARLIAQRAMWNCGVFAFSLKFMLGYLDRNGLPTAYEPLLERYEQLPELSFDHEVVEKTSHVVVIAYDKAWHDLGSWSTLTSYLETSVIGSGGLSDDSVNSHLVNELPYPIHVIDVSNIIVAASPDGILVASKSSSNQIKEKLSGVRQRPMYEEKSWGTYRILDYSRTDNETEMITKKAKLLAGKHISCHSHQKRKEIWTILSGSGEFILDESVYKVKTGDVVQIPCGVKHGMKAIEALECIEIQIGTDLSEEDCIYFPTSWEDAASGSKDGV